MRLYTLPKAPSSFRRCSTARCKPHPAARGPCPWAAIQTRRDPRPPLGSIRWRSRSIGPTKYRCVQTTTFAQPYQAPGGLDRGYACCMPGHAAGPRACPLRHHSGKAHAPQGLRSHCSPDGTTSTGHPDRNSADQPTQLASLATQWGGAVQVHCRHGQVGKGPAPCASPDMSVPYSTHGSPVCPWQLALRCAALCIMHAAVATTPRQAPACAMPPRCMAGPAACQRPGHTDQG